MPPSSTHRPHTPPPPYNHNHLPAGERTAFTYANVERHRQVSVDYVAPPIDEPRYASIDPVCPDLPYRPTHRKECPRCRVGRMHHHYSLCGVALAVLFFPIGTLCCVATRKKRCNNCGIIYRQRRVPRQRTHIDESDAYVIDHDAVSTLRRSRENSTHSSHVGRSTPPNHDHPTPTRSQSLPTTTMPNIGPAPDADELFSRAMAAELRRLDLTGRHEAKLQIFNILFHNDSSPPCYSSA